MSIKSITLSQSLFGCLLAILFLAPLFFGCTLEWTAAALTLLVSLLGMATVLAIAFQKIRIPKVFISAYPFHLCFILLITWQFLMPQWIEMVDEYNYQVGLRLTITYYVIFCTTLALASSEKRLLILLSFLVVCGFLQAIYGILMVFSGIEMSFYLPKNHSFGIATGTLSTRNTFAGYMEITLACGLGLLVGHLTKVKFDSTRERTVHFLELLFSAKILLRVAIGIMVIGLVMSHSRMGNVGFFLSMIVSAILYVILQRQFTKRAFILFASLILIDTLIVSQYFGLDELINRLKSTSFQVELEKNHNTADANDGAKKTLVNDKTNTELDVASDESRAKAWTEIYPMVKDFGLKGGGYGSFYTLFPQYRTGLAQGLFRHAHNDYLEVIIEFGYFGAALMGFLAVFAIFISIKTLKSRKNKVALSAAFAALMGLISIAIHSTADFNLYIPANAATVCVLLAIAALSQWGDFDKKTLKSSRSRSTSRVATPST